MVLEVIDFCYFIEFVYISFCLCKGEIFGFYGLVGVGCIELMQVFFGVLCFFFGEICLNGRIMCFYQFVDVICVGIVCVLEEWQKQGVIIVLFIVQNISLLQFSKFNFNGVLNDVWEWWLVDEYVLCLQVKVFSWWQLVEIFFGGNQQKVVIGKWLVIQFEVIIFDELIKGIDIGLKVVVYQFMFELVSQGLVVIMVLLELLEVMGMVDWIIVMYEGQMVVEYWVGEVMVEIIVSVVSGIGQEVV